MTFTARICTKSIRRHSSAAAWSNFSEPHPALSSSSRPYDFQTRLAARRISGGCTLSRQYRSPRRFLDFSRTEIETAFHGRRTWTHRLGLPLGLCPLLPDCRPDRRSFFQTETRDAESVAVERRDCAHRVQ